MTKRQGWEGHLTSYLRSIRLSEFTPSELDCAFFGVDCAALISSRPEVLKAIKFAKKFRGKYTTVARGKALLARKGYTDHVDYVASVLEEHESPLWAQRGDLAVVVEGENTALGIVQGAKIYVMTPRGLGVVPLSMAVRAFKL